MARINLTSILHSTLTYPKLRDILEGIKECDIVEMYRNGSTGFWTPAATFVPVHNQACERLIDDIKRSKDIDKLVTLHERREKRPRTRSKLVVKGNSLKVV